MPLSRGLENALDMLRSTTGWPFSAVAPHDPPRQADACRCAMGRPILVNGLSYRCRFSLCDRRQASCERMAASRGDGSGRNGLMAVTPRYVKPF
jgi:hypothetical protein